MRSVKEIYDYNKDNDYGKSVNDRMTYNAFAYTAKQLKEDEVVNVAFMGILYYQVSAQFTQWYATLITDQRIIVGLYGLFNKEMKIFDLKDYHSFENKDTGSYQTITFIGDGQTLNIGVLKHRGDDLAHDIASKTNLKHIK
ncbi:MAG: hypothetical protein GX845_05725 [Erysipelothrix sp.]|nr:hypothetical protein [Erysipelothrix sp.]